MAYDAEDGDARRGTVSQVAQLNWTPAASRRCNATIVMMDDRRHVPLANNSKDIGYFHKAMMLNLLYAQRHGMSFLIVRPTAAMEDSWLDGGASGLCPAWCRVKILASLVASRLAANGCHWVLYIDSDAYIREQHVDFLERLDTPANRDVHFAFAREELPAGGFRSPRKRSHGVRVPSLNAGVLFVRASAWSARLLAVWMRAAQLPVCAPFRSSGRASSSASTSSCAIARYSQRAGARASQAPRCSFSTRPMASSSGTYGAGRASSCAAAPLTTSFESRACGAGSRCMLSSRAHSDSGSTGRVDASVLTHGRYRRHGARARPQRAVPREELKS